MLQHAKAQSPTVHLHAQACGLPLLLNGLARDLLSQIGKTIKVQVYRAIPPAATAEPSLTAM